MSAGHPETLQHVIVAKVGSSSLVDEQGAFDTSRVADFAAQAAELAQKGWHPVIVSSGAVAVGMERLGFLERPRDMPGLQAAAAAGQAALTEAYAHELERFGLACAQILLNRRDVVNRESYLNIRHTLGRLLELGVIPVVNENDTTSVTEFSFGDNDLLGAIVAVLVGAERYVILTDIDGLYTEDPTINASATRIEHLEDISEELLDAAGESQSALGTGGMRSKLMAARALLAAGIPLAIVSSRSSQALVRSAEGTVEGTLVEAPGKSPEPARKLWIALASVPQGSLVVDSGAAAALVERGASLLPVGVTAVEGAFNEGDVVSVKDSDGHLLARGISRFGAKELEQFRGLTLDVVARFMPDKAGSPAIHRNELLVF